VLDLDQIRKTEERFQRRRQEREATESLIAAGEILRADTPVRVQRRLERMGVPGPLAAEAVRAGVPLPTERAAVAAAPAPARQPMPAPVLNALERIIGTNDFVEASFLEAGARAARAVCRIEIAQPNGLVVGYGTGVLVSPRLVLTNNHVLESAQDASASTAEFRYELDLDGEENTPVRFRLDPTACYLTDPTLDYSLVAVQPTAETGESLSDFGWAPLIEQQGKVIKGERVNIVQHPNGELKRVALRENQVVDLLDLFMHYKTDTSPGSSGSPVFNDEWEMVALHHSGVPARDAEGNMLAIDGSIWTPEMGEHRVKWIANEGARVSRIVQHVQEHRDEVGEPALIVEALGGPSAAPERRTERPPAPPLPHLPPPSPRPAADGTVTWTIPLQVTVQLGPPTVGLGQIPAPAPAVPSVPPVTPVGPPLGDGELAEALGELERGRARPYYAAAQDADDRDAYFQGLPERRTGEAFFTALSDLLTRTHLDQPRYAPSRHVYPWVDLQPNKMLKSIYTGEEYDPASFIEQDVLTERARAARLREMLATEAVRGGPALEEAIDALEALLPYNCEHVVPQSWFNKREPMRGDLHHLFACESRCNSFRGNTPYLEFPQFEEAVRPGCGMVEADGFEPSRGKGPAARATLYFLLRYPGQIDATIEEYEPERLALLLAWHAAEPVTEWERHRNAAIFEKQGNRNPLIDYPDWATEISFEHGLGGVARGRRRRRER
jgi:endonuclease I/V8-like Glu-specific endopeptidase